MNGFSARAFPPNRKQRKPAQRIVARVFESSLVRQNAQRILSSRFRVFPFCRPFCCPDCCCSAAVCPAPWVGRLLCCHLLVDAYLPASGQTLLSGANSQSPTLTIFFLSRTSSFPILLMLYQARMGGRVKRCAGLIRAITMPEGQSAPYRRSPSLPYQ